MGYKGRRVLVWIRRYWYITIKWHELMNKPMSNLNNSIDFVYLQQTDYSVVWYGRWSSVYVFRSFWKVKDLKEGRWMSIFPLPHSVWSFELLYIWSLHIMYWLNHIMCSWVNILLNKLPFSITMNCASVANGWTF